GLSSRDEAARAKLAARGTTRGPSDRSADELPPPVDFSKVDHDLDLHGTVVDGKDAPVAGADLVSVTYPFDRASILDMEHQGQGVEGPRTKSAGNGSFVLRVR